MSQTLANVIAVEAPRAALREGIGRFDAQRAREACVSLVKVCERLDGAPRHSRPAEAREELKEFGEAMFEALRALAPCASDYALSEAALAVTLLFSASRLSLEPEARGAAKVVSLGRS